MNDENFKAVLASSIAHDLRNPLSVVIAYSHLLSKSLEELSVDSRTIKQIERIRRSAERVDQLIQNLVDLTQIEKGGLQLERTVTDVKKILSDSLEVLSAWSQEKNIVLKVSQADGPIQAVTDELRIRQIFTALVQNAIQYCRDGSRVNVSLAQTEEEVTLEVSDQGCGIANERMASIFDLPQTKPGTLPIKQMSLYIAREAARAHGGDIEATSRGEGKGSTFKVRFRKG
ncbi:MAG: HAMP domain-containing sensor histidine kinase [Bdellovibrionota bacterium]